MAIAKRTTQTTVVQPKSEGIDLSDLQNADINKTIIRSDSAFGMGDDVWAEAQKIADLLPFTLKVNGDLDDEAMSDIAEVAKGAEIQQRSWGEYCGNVSRIIKAYKKTIEYQASTAEAISDARVEITGLEANLRKSLANNESKHRVTVANSRAAVQNIQDVLVVKLTDISNKYLEGKKKLVEASTQQAAEEKVPSAFETQMAELGTRFRELRESRHDKSSTITKRIPAIGGSKA